MDTFAEIASATSTVSVVPLVAFAATTTRRVGTADAFVAHSHAVSDAVATASFGYGVGEGSDDQRAQRDPLQPDGCSSQHRHPLRCVYCLGVQGRVPSVRPYGLINSPLAPF
jgi:hypothetical protein